MAQIVNNQVSWKKEEILENKANLSGKSIKYFDILIHFLSFVDSKNLS